MTTEAPTDQPTEPKVRPLHDPSLYTNRELSWLEFNQRVLDPLVVEDVSEVFNYLTGYSKRVEYRQLLIAPVGLRSSLLGLLDREMQHAREGRPGRVIFKNNAITDPAMVRALYRASRAGVDADLIVRGVCSLKPGVPNISERIRVRSVVGRFLEHSRVYWFSNGGNEELYLGSADLMERNLDRRVEVLCRVRDPAMVRHVRDVVLEAYLRDTERAYDLTVDGYQRITGEESTRVNAQQYLLDWYTSRPVSVDGD